MHSHNNSRYNNPYLIEKLVSALSYLTAGLIGFVWLLLGIFTKSNLRPFLKYHIFQSIFLSIAYFLAIQLLGMLASIINFIPLVRNIFSMLIFPLIIPVVFGFSIIQILIYTVILYLVLTSLMGRYSYLPWISDIIKMNVRN
ncbi:MAG: hypothetical protein ACI37S_08150 [Candidatus Gastranaerophilaceae bacterium]